MVVGLFVGSSQPVAVGLFTAPWDKLAHATVFVVLTALLAAPSIHTGPIITKLLDKVPADMRESFSPDQLLALKVALYPVKSALGIDLLPGFSLGLWGWFQEEVSR